MCLVTLLKHDVKIACQYNGVPYTIFNAGKCAANPRFWPIVIYRISYQLYKVKILRILSWILSLANRLCFGIDIPPKIKIGGGLFFPHPQNIILGAASVGEEVVIYHNVTLGAKFLDFEASCFTRPSIGNRVTLGCNTTILGSYVMEDNTKCPPHTLIRK